MACEDPDRLQQIHRVRVREIDRVAPGRAPEVFDVTARPWITPDNADAAAVAAVVDRCPSGALRYTRHDGPADAPHG
ncbi:(4Fe-4S)-binding protein [Catenuloplanes indicus]|uniref:(4Fe-4S)-binding protein n=1 Tax=Catenuloplanes indicus TaxID=137267 RepID=UPI0027D91ACC|nr:(4Fe-4S)-binding protein [Catenuloplanes indicus]